MNREELLALPIDVLLKRTETGSTGDPHEGFEIAKFAYTERAVSPVEVGTAARQAAFRAEQAGESPEVVAQWFERSREALNTNEPAIQRELIATELLTTRAFGLRIERLERVGSEVVRLAQAASKAGERGETIAQEQHERGKPWDRFGVMLARHRATHEAMNGDSHLAARCAVQGIWRALRARREELETARSPQEKAVAIAKHGMFVAEQAVSSAFAGALALSSRPSERIRPFQYIRHRVALWLLG